MWWRNLVGLYRSFRGMRCLYLEGRRVIQAHGFFIMQFPPHPPVTLSPLVPRILLSTHVSNTPNMRSSIFWDVTPCSPLKVNRSFEGKCRLRNSSISPDYEALWSQWPRGLRHKPSSLIVHSNTGIVRSNPTRGLDVCVRLFCACVVMCVGSGPATDWSPVQGVLQTVYRLRNWKSGQGPQGL
jgi:hypothetical protein